MGLFDNKIRNFFIIVGCNYTNLSGCVNDAYLMYNLFKKNDNNRIILFTDKEKKVLKEEIKNSIIEIHKENNLSNIPYRIIFTFAGHGYSNGSIQLSDCRVSCNELYNLLNSDSCNNFEVIIILDSCYSGGFTNLGTYGNICKITVITSCNSSQKSVESVATINNINNNNFKKLDCFNNNNFYTGIFTYNFTNIVEELLIKKKKITLENIFNNSIWNNISIIGNQSYQIKK